MMDHTMTYSQIRSLAQSASLEVERLHLERALVASGWSLAATARSLDTRPTTLQRALERHPDLAARLQDGRRGNPGRPPKPAESQG